MDPTFSAGARSEAEFLAIISPGGAAVGYGLTCTGCLAALNYLISADAFIIRSISDGATEGIGDKALAEGLDTIDRCSRSLPLGQLTSRAENVVDNVAATANVADVILVDLVKCQ